LVLREPAGKQEGRGLKIGPLETEPGALLAPLCGVTTRAFRKVCRRQGASIVYSETISSDGIFQLNMRTIEMARFDPEERPMGVQIFGSEPQRIALAARIVEEMLQPDLIDLNFGCPVPKFTRNHRGAALLKDLPRIGAIVRAVTGTVSTPVTAKIRAGWNEESIRAAEIARIVEGEGAVALTVHGRTRTQAYRGEANWEWIAEAVRAVSIPVIGNGDVADGETALRRIRETGCAAVMIGRASIGNPWIFRSIAHRIRSGVEPPELTAEEKLRTILEHLALHLDEQGIRTGIFQFRRHLSSYVKGLPGCSAFRDWANRIESADVLEEGIRRFFGGLERETTHGS